MKKLIATEALLLMIPMIALAQNDDHPYRAEGYSFAAYQVKVGPAGGGGGEYFVYKGFGVGGEFSKGSPFGEYTFSVNGYFGVPSTNKNKLELFVTGGVTHFSVGTSAPLLLMAPISALGPAYG